MAIPVKLQVFEGPLDLLLHLISKNKIDIYDIPIVLITDQYMEYIRNMEHDDMNVTSEFMLMAATLLDIKCRMLLPVEETEDDEEEDPRAALVQQLLEYKKYKYISGELRDLMDDAGETVTRPQILPQEVIRYRPPVSVEELLEKVKLERLQQIFEDVLRKQQDKMDPVRSKFGKIEKEEVSLAEKLSTVERAIIKKRKSSFRQLLEGQKTRTQIVVTFLAVLELIKSGKISVSQEGIGEDILIESSQDENTIVEDYTEANLDYN